MKGMELPVSTMIVVAVAVLVLVVLSSFFLSGCKDAAGADSIRLPLRFRRTRSRPASST